MKTSEAPIITQDEIDTILDSLYNGQYKQAKSQIMEGCKTKPEKLAYRVGFLVKVLAEQMDFPRIQRVLAMFE